MYVLSDTTKIADFTQAFPKMPTLNSFKEINFCGINNRNFGPKLDI